VADKSSESMGGFDTDEMVSEWLKAVTIYATTPTTEK
jgi:hypothetical protein